MERSCGVAGGINRVKWIDEDTMFIGREQNDSLCSLTRTAFLVVNGRKIYI